VLSLRIGRDLGLQPLDVRSEDERLLVADLADDAMISGFSAWYCARRSSSGTRIGVSWRTTAAFI